MIGRHKMPAAVLFAAVGGTMLWASIAGAMPGFARKYQMSCTTCHAPFPRLKAYGDEFAARGFRMEESQEPKRAYTNTGDELLTLQKTPPIGFRMEGFASWKEDAPAEDDFEWPWAWKILSGGPLSKTASYYFYFIVEGGEVAGLEDAYVQFNDVFGLPVDVLAGQFQVCDPLFKRETRLMRSDYLIYKAQVGDSDLDLTYDRGLILSTTAPGEIDVILQVINGNGIGAAEDGNFDKDNNKNGALRLARMFGDIRVGAFGYYGFDEGAPGRENETLYFGPDLVLPLGSRVELNLQYLERRDDNPYFDADLPDESLETRGGFAELHFFPEGHDGRWVLSALYNKVDSDDETANRETFSLTANRLLARNVRLLGEVAYDMEEELTRATVGLVSAF
jgi:hypothetical protein